MTTQKDVTATRAKVEAALRRIDTAMRDELRPVGEIERLAENLITVTAHYRAALVELRGPVVASPPDLQLRRHKR